MRSHTSRPRRARRWTGWATAGFWMGYFAARSAPLGMMPPHESGDRGLLQLRPRAGRQGACPRRGRSRARRPWRCRPWQQSALAALRRYGLGTAAECPCSRSRTGGQGGAPRPARRATALRREFGRCRGRTIRWPRCGMPRRCCASSAATRMWRSWLHVVCQAGNATFCRLRPARFRATTWPSPATTTRRRGVITKSSGRAGWSATTER